MIFLIIGLFFQHLSNPTRYVCKLAKTFGGVLMMGGGKLMKKWYSTYGFRIFPILISLFSIVFDFSVEHHAGSVNGAGRDGIKTLCLDDIYRDIKNKKCLIYSFGIADDWTFEEYMASLGCKVLFISEYFWSFWKIA